MNDEAVADSAGDRFELEIRGLAVAGKPHATSGPPRDSGWIIGLSRLDERLCRRGNVSPRRFDLSLRAHKKYG